MTDTELLQKIKIGLGISDTYHDDVLKLHIESAKDIMRSSGVRKAVVNSSVSVGCILAIVNDLYNYSSGGVKLSDFSVKRIIQLCYVTEDEVTDNVQTE